MNTTVRSQSRFRQLDALQILLAVLPLVALTDRWLQARLVSLAVPPLPLKLLTDLGDGRVDLILALLLLWANRQAGKAALGSFLTSGLLVNVLKYTVGRVRPYALAGPWVFAGPTVNGTYSSFPSGHAATVFALATVVGLSYPKWRSPALTVAGLVGLSRIAIGMHWPTDVVAGAALGIFSARWWWHRQAAGSRTRRDLSQPA